MKLSQTQSNGFTEHQELNELPQFDKNLLNYIIHTKVGEGPQKLPNNNDDDTLLDVNGQPKF